MNKYFHKIIIEFCLLLKNFIPIETTENFKDQS